MGHHAVDLVMLSVDHSTRRFRKQNATSTPALSRRSSQRPLQAFCQRRSNDCFTELSCQILCGIEYAWQPLDAVQGACSTSTAAAAAAAAEVAAEALLILMHCLCYAVCSMQKCLSDQWCWHPLLQLLAVASDNTQLGQEADT
jgi:hypothetical protein